MRSLAAVLTLLALAAHAAAQDSPQPPSTIRVTFQLNDALLKGQVLAGAAVHLRGEDDAFQAKGVTDGTGRLALEVPPGRYLISYSLQGYVPIESSPTELRTAGQLVTTTLSMNLEAEGLAPDTQRLKLILNWGSDRAQHVEDADSHLACPCAEAGHVYFGGKTHAAHGHQVSLDVDDMDWGGPETIKVLRPPAGSYVYWVYDYSSGDQRLVDSDVVVRLVVGDVQVGEYRIRPEHAGRLWRPFKTLEVDDAGRVVVTSFGDAELAAQADARLPESLSLFITHTNAQDDAGDLLAVCALSVLVVVAVVTAVARRAARRRAADA